MSVEKDLITKEETELVAQRPMGFEDEEAGDMIIPRVKVIQTLSPERKDGEAEEGDIINSLTKDKYNGKMFVPVFKFNNNIEWKPRSEGGGIKCIARDGKTGEDEDGTILWCATCRRNEFDNTKQGKDAAPKCTKYINFFGFFAGERMPIILSFGKTNYSEGKKLYSLAKVTMQNMWNYGYRLDEKLKAKSGNEWYIIVPSAAGPTEESDREFAHMMYKEYRSVIQSVQVDVEDVSPGDPTPDIEKTEF